MNQNSQPKVEADQLESPKDEERDDAETLVEQESRTNKRVAQEQQGDTMAEASDYSAGVIYDLTDRPINVRPQPPGVWVAITKRVSETIKDVIESLNAEGLASLILLNEIGDAEGVNAANMKANAIGTAIKEAVPRLLSKFSEKAPEVLCDVVSMILEPNPMVIKEERERRFTSEWLHWNVSVDQQIAAVSIYIDSLNIGELSGKVKALLPTESLSRAAAGTRS